MIIPGFNESNADVRVTLKTNNMTKTVNEKIKTAKEVTNKTVNNLKSKYDPNGNIEKTAKKVGTSAKNDVKKTVSTIKKDIAPKIQTSVDKLKEDVWSWLKKK